MAIDRSNPEFLEKLHNIEVEIGKKTKELILRLDSWWFFMHFISSYKGSTNSDKDCDFVLTTQQATEIAFSYNPTKFPDTFVLLLQPQFYECLKHIGLNSAIITPTGLVCYIKETNIYGKYISSFSFKIPFSTNLENSLKTAITLCTNFQIASISGQYDSYYEQTFWAIDEVNPIQYPLFKNRHQALSYNLENQDKE